MSVTTRGEQGIRRELLKLAKQYPGAAGAALYQEGMDLWNASVKRAPVEFGVLRNSAYVSPPTQRGANVTVEVGFGTEYAIPQHERLDYQHPRGGEAKYLATSIAVAQGGALARLAERTRRNVASGVTAPAIGAAPEKPKAGGSSRRSRRRRR
jgi:hypothetical protein